MPASGGVYPWMWFFVLRDVEEYHQPTETNMAQINTNKN